MREIKFRAWEEHNEYMFDCNIVSGNKGYPDWQSFEDGAPSSEILMQFTGLKDKNGVEIYEGDAIKINNDDKIVGKIIFKEGSFMIAEENDLTYLHCYKESQIEVIGNIYQNPELLE